MSGHFATDKVVVELNGGLGNQMFEYAAARTLADRRQCQLVLDLRRVDSLGARGYELNKFNIRADGLIRGRSDEVPTRGPMLTLRSRLAYRSAAHRQSDVPDGCVPYRLQENAQRRDLHDAPRAVWLRGYMQAPSIWADEADAIRRDFTWVNPPVTRAPQASDVAMHVRRGDYLHAKNIGMHPPLGVDYYNRARAHFLSANPSAKFIVHTDDPGWCQVNLEDDSTTVAAGHDSRSDADLCAMSKYRRHVIANSTYSWWAAWLAQSEAVVAPNQWFGNGRLGTVQLGEWHVI
jgi:hypothetical protein